MYFWRTDKLMMSWSEAVGGTGDCCWNVCQRCENSSRGGGGGGLGTALWVLAGGWTALGGWLCPPGSGLGACAVSPIDPDNVLTAAAVRR